MPHATCSMQHAKQAETLVQKQAHKHYLYIYTYEQAEKYGIY